VDGEVVVLDSSGCPDFHLLQSFRSQAARIHYFVFDLLCCKSRDLARLPLVERRELMRSLLKLSSPRIHVSEHVEGSASAMLSVVREQGLEGIVAKRRESLYEPGKRTGAWIKYRVNRGQEFVIGGYIPGPHGLDSLIVGYYRGKDLIYVARVRSGFVPASRRDVFEKLRGLASPTCAFVNLPDKRPSR
jgi:ATP-dependent DNA ligase